jgi:bifunctional N-acetylglucosamine-1-phosphate-uridyltransferase/glucosamine-1-phosphate-acetyltransferase GlmU-like protein
MNTLLLPCAGDGSRLAEVGPKCLVNVAGKTILSHILNKIGDFFDEIIIVIKPSQEILFENTISNFVNLEKKVKYVEQIIPSGTLDAVQIGLKAASALNNVVIVWGDQIGVSQSTIGRVLSAIEKNEQSFVVPVIETEYPYVWVELSQLNLISQVWRSRDGDIPPNLGYADIGVFGLGKKLASDCIEKIDNFNDNSSRERDFIYLLPGLSSDSDDREIIFTTDKTQLISINTPDELKSAHEFF